MEHPTGRIGRVHTPRPYEMWDAFQKRFMPSGPPLAPVLRLADATQRAARALNSIATFKLQRPPSLGVPIGNRIYQNLKHGIDPNRRGRALDHAYRGVRAWFQREIRGPFKRLRARMGKSGLYLIVRGEQAPNPDSRVRLSTRARRARQACAPISTGSSARPTSTARACSSTRSTPSCKRLGLGSVEPSEWLASPGPQWPVDPTVGNHPIAGYHHMGTTRMSARSGGGRGHRRLQRVRLRQPVRRGQLGVQHQRLGQPDVDHRRARAAPCRPSRRPAEGDARPSATRYFTSAS